MGVDVTSLVVGTPSCRVRPWLPLGVAGRSHGARGEFSSGGVEGAERAAGVRGSLKIGNEPLEQFGRPLVQAGHIVSIGLIGHSDSPSGGV